MKNTGLKLKSAREAQRISVNEVAMATKISPRMIQAIEDGDSDALPAKTFLRGFVQSYASYLKLDVDDLLEVFHEEMGSTLPQTAPPAETTHVEDKEEKHIPPLLNDRGLWPKVAMGAAILLLIFVIVGVKSIVEKYEKEAETSVVPEDIASLENPIVEKKNPQPEETSDSKLESSSAAVSDTTEPEVPSATSTSETSDVVASQTENSPNQDPPAPPTSEAKVDAEVAKPASVEPQKPAAPVLNKNEIIVEALDKVDIQFRVGSGDLKKISLRPDQIHTIKAIGPVNLDLSDGGAVNIIHNGRDKGVPGDLGKPKKVKIQ